MSYYQIGTVPAQLFAGMQDTVTIYNTGPQTVYLDSNASVTPGSGFELPPFATMTWQKHTELWAVVRDLSPLILAGSAAQNMTTLSVSPAGVIANTAKGKFWRALWVRSLGSGAVGFRGMPIECESSESLLVQVTHAAIAVPATIVCTITWYDVNFNALYTQSFEMVIMQKGSDIAGGQGVVSFQTPVIGAFAVLGFTPSAPPSPNLPRMLTIGAFGTDRVLDIATWHTPQPYLYVGTGLGSPYTFTPQSLSIQGYSYNATCYLPTLGSRLNVYAQNNGGDVGTSIRFSDPYSGDQFFDMIIAANAGISTALDRAIPAQRGLMVSNVGAVSTSAGSLTLVFDN